ncbi:hypothetical protein Tco_0663457 [Tanacetum coccineum]
MDYCYGGMTTLLYKFKEGRLPTDFGSKELQTSASSSAGKGDKLQRGRTGFIYENKDKKNRLMRIDELHKFSDGTLDDVQIALNDRLKGIRMEYLPQTFWSQRDKVNARAMIQAIDKRLKTRRIMRSLERYIGGRLRG